MSYLNSSVTGYNPYMNSQTIQGLITSGASSSTIQSVVNSSAFSSYMNNLSSSYENLISSPTITGGNVDESLAEVGMAIDPTTGAPVVTGNATLGSMGTLGGVSLSDLGFGTVPTNTDGTYNLLGDGGLAEQLDNIGAANGVGTVTQLNDEYELAEQQANANAQIAPLESELASEQSTSSTPSVTSTTPTVSSPTLLDTLSTFLSPTTTSTSTTSSSSSSSTSSSASSDLLGAISSLMSLVLGSL
jgi:hypothetical protein